MSGLALALLLTAGSPTSSIEKDVCSERDHPAVCVHQVRRAYRKCGPEGAVDWDDNPAFPPPHCNRNGWNGRRYVEEPRS